MRSKYAEVWQKVDGKIAEALELVDKTKEVQTVTIDLSKVGERKSYAACGAIGEKEITIDCMATGRSLQFYMADKNLKKVYRYSIKDDGTELRLRPVQK